MPKFAQIWLPPFRRITGQGLLWIQLQISMCKDAFSRWVEVETVRCAGSLPGRLVNMQLLSWLTAVQAT